MPGLVESRIVPFDLTSIAGGPAVGSTAGAPYAASFGAGQVKATTVAFLADGGNAAKVFIGTEGVASFPLAANQQVVLDAAEGYWINLSQLTVDGRGTGGLVVHCIALTVPG